MQMPLLVTSEADLKLSAAIWTQIASKREHPVPSAIRYNSCACFLIFPCPNISNIYFSRSPGEARQYSDSEKFYKLKKECEQLKTDGGPSTPKFKASRSIKTPKPVADAKAKTLLSRIENLPRSAQRWMPKTYLRSSLKWKKLKMRPRSRRTAMPMRLQSGTSLGNIDEKVLERVHMIRPRDRNELV